MAKLQFLNKVEGLPAIINIKIKKIFEEKTDNYGKIKKCCVVDYNGTEYYADFKSKDWNLLSEGAVLSAVKKLYDGSPYFEFYGGSVNSEAHRAVHTPATPQPTDNGGLMGRGASWNNAFSYCIKNWDGLDSFDSFMSKVTETAEKIVPYQSKFINK